MRERDGISPIFSCQGRGKPRAGWLDEPGDSHIIVPGTFDGSLEKDWQRPIGTPLELAPMYELDHEFWTTNHERAELKRTFLQFRENIRSVETEVELAEQIGPLSDCVMQWVPYTSSAAVFPHVLEVIDSLRSGRIKMLLLTSCLSLWVTSDKWGRMKKETIGYDSAEFDLRLRGILLSHFQLAESTRERCAFFRGIAMTSGDLNLAFRMGEIEDDYS